MSEQLLSRALREAEAPESGAARARALQAALGSRAERPAREWTEGLRPLAALAAVAAALLLAFTPPGEAVADWLSRAVHARLAPKALPHRSDLPGSGRLLVAAGGRAWLVRPDGHRTALGRWSRVAWSPHGLFVAAWRGRTLAALDPEGHVRWSVRSLGRVHAVAWSPQGFHVVYLAGDRIRVVSGQGLGDTPLRRAPEPSSLAREDAGPVTPVAPAFRPGAPRTLAFVTAGRRVEVVDVYTGALLWRSHGRVASGVRAIAWTGDGARLVALGRRRIQRWTADGHALGAWRLPTGRRGLALAAAPRGRRIAVAALDRATGHGEVLIASARSQRVFTGAGRLTSLAWSPDARWLVGTWPRSSLLLFLRADRPSRAVGAVSEVGRRPGILGGWAR